MADVPATKGDSDLLEMELGLAVSEDDFRKAEKEMDKLQDKFNSMTTSSQIELKAPNLDGIIQKIQKLIAVIDKLNQMGIDLALNQLGGIQYGMTPYEYASVNALKGSVFEKELDVSPEAILPAVAGIQTDIAQIYSKGKVPANEKFMNVVDIGRALVARGVKGAEEIASTENLQALFIDKNADAFSVLGKLYNYAEQALELSGDDPELANKVQSFMHDFLTPQLAKLVSVNADKNIATGDKGFSFWDFMLGVLPELAINPDLAGKSLDNVLTIFSNKTQASANLNRAKQNVGNASLTVTSAWWEAINRFTSAFSPDVGSFKVNKGTSVIGNEGLSPGNDVALMEQSARAIGYSGTGAKTYGVPGYATGKDDEVKRRRGLAFALYKDKDKSNDWKAEEILANSILYDEMSNPEVRDINAFLRADAVKYISAKGKYSEKELNDIFTEKGAIGSEVFDIAFDQGMISEEEYMTAIGKFLEQFKLTNRAKKKLGLEGIDDYGEDLRNKSNKKDETVQNLHFEIVVKNEKGEELGTVSHSTVGSDLEYLR